MNAALVIAANSVREASRNKIFYSILFFAILVILNSFVATEFTIAVYDRILRDVGTGAIDFFGALLAIFLGITLVSREVDRKTLYTVVTRPIRRSEFVLGKFLGLLAVLTVTLGVMFVSFLVVLYASSMDPPLLQPLLWYLALTMMELAVIVAFATLMSTFSSSAIAAFATVAVYVFGHLSEELYFFGQRAETLGVKVLSSALYFGLPNFRRFDVSHAISHNEAVVPSTAGLALLYGLMFTAAFLIAAVLVFGRKDFK